MSTVTGNRSGTVSMVVSLSIVLIGAELEGSPAGAAVKGKKSEVWLLSGQSNACGKADPNPALIGNPAVEIFDPAKGDWVQAAEPLVGMRYEDPTGNMGLGPWLQAALDVAGKSGTGIRLTGTGCDGQPLSFWAEGQDGWKVFSDRINKAGKGADVFLWYQGESDALANSLTYQADLKAFAARVRVAAESPRMMIVVIQLGALGQDDGSTYAAVREAQRRFVIEDGNAILVPAVGRSVADTWHLSRAGYLELGQEIGRALLKTRHHNKDVDWPGPVLDKAVLKGDGKTVVAHFAEVNQLGGCLAEDFAIVAPDGKATIKAKAIKVETGKTLVKLTFQDSVTLPAALAYAPGNRPQATLVDEAGNRAPAVQLPITQGTVPADKPSIATK